MYNSIVFCIFDPKLGIMTRLLTFICLFVAIAHVQAKSSQEVEVRANGVVTRVIFFSPEIVRVVKCPGEMIDQTKEGLVVTMAPQNNLEISIIDARRIVYINSAFR